MRDFSHTTISITIKYRGMKGMKEYVAPEIFACEVAVESGIAVSEVTATVGFGFSEYEEVDM